MFILYVILVVAGLVAVGDGLFFFARRDVIEPNVHARYPNLNCGRLATLEIIAGVLLVLSPLSVFI